MPKLTGFDALKAWMKKNEHTHQWLADRIGRSKSAISQHFTRHEWDPDHRVPEAWVNKLEQLSPVELSRIVLRPDWFDVFHKTPAKKNRKRPTTKKRGRPTR